MNSKKITCLLLAALLYWPISAKVALPNLFTSHMVLQQQSQQKLWGTAKANKPVYVITSWNGARYETKADAAGKWALTIDTPKAGGPYTITFSDGTPLVLDNILIGEVWLCGGQSNMEMQVSGVRNAKQEIEQASSYPTIRLLHVDNKTSTVPMENAVIRDGGWQVCSSQTIGSFSASGYFFGRALNQALDVPIGLIECCWGGTLAEAWTSSESLSQIPFFSSRLAKLKTLPSSLEERNELYVKDMEQWAVDMAAVDPGYSQGKAVWAAPDFIDNGWQTIPVPGYYQEQGLVGFTGIMWMRKTVTIPQSWEKQALTLSLAAIDDNDFTYFNGVVVGHTEGFGARRVYQIPANLVKSGKAVVAVRVMDTGGLGGINGAPASIALTNAAGESISLTGNWQCQSSLPLEKVPEFPANTAYDANYVSFLYNAMLYPLANYTIKGAIWYQGEANVNRAAQYADLLPLMINDWRQLWGYEFPFYIVQLANYMKRQEAPEESVWADLRDAQLQTALHTRSTGMAVIIDIGEENDIHPKNKQEVGRRLALCALADTYHQKVVASGPQYTNYELEGTSIRLSFAHTHGGTCTPNGESLQGFTIAGPDHIFYWAEATIEDNQIIVSSPHVSFPVAVRYGWANNPICNLYNGVGLPASPFRTDNWALSN